MDQLCATAKSDGTPATCNWTAAGFQLNGGANPYVANINGTNADAIFGKYPLPNTDSVGYGLDFRGFTFAAPNPTKHDTYILRLDYKLTQSGKHNLFVKGHLQNWHTNGVPQFPGLPSNDFQTNNSKGLFAGYTALFTNNLINNLRYGFVRQGTEAIPVSVCPTIIFSAAWRTSREPDSRPALLPPSLCTTSLTT